MASFGSTERIDRRVQNVTLAEKPDTVLRKNLCSRKLNENGANSMAILRLSGRRQNRDCSRNCNCQSLQEPQTSTDFNDRHATGSISISYKPQLSTDFNNLWNLVRDQGVGGSNPLSPTNYFQPLTPTAKAQNPTPWFCTRFHNIPERRNPHKCCTSFIARDARPSTKSTTSV